MLNYKVKEREMNTETFIASLRTVSKDLAFWARMEINRGATLE